MAVKTVTNPQKIQWLSSDRPPIASDGSEGLTVDTGQMWIWHDGTWVPDLRLEAILKRVFDK